MGTILVEVNDPELREGLLRHGLWAALAALGEDTRGLWGRMSPQQMVEHLVWTFEVSTGRVHVECPVPEAQRERMKAFLYQNRPTPPDFMNPALAEGLPPLRHSGLDEAKAALRVEVDRFLEESRDGVGELRVHPLFGPIGREEWSRTHYKHTRHQLLQFGLLETDTR